MVHTMTKINERGGREEWMCLSCGRHLVVSWDPIFKTTVLVQGDTSAQHAGLRKNTPVTANGDVPAALEEDSWLEPWIEWMNAIGFEDLWDGEAP